MFDARLQCLHQYICLLNGSLHINLVIGSSLLHVTELSCLRVFVCVCVWAPHRPGGSGPKSASRTPHAQLPNRHTVYEQSLFQRRSSELKQNRIPPSQKWSSKTPDCA